MAKDNVKRSVEFSAELYAKLEELAKELDIPISSIIKLACNEYIKKQGKESDQ